MPRGTKFDVLAFYLMQKLGLTLTRDGNRMSISGVVYCLPRHRDETLRRWVHRALYLYAARLISAANEAPDHGR